MHLPPCPSKKSHIHRSPFESREDPYHWLRDDQRQDPEVLAHLQAENAYFEAHRAEFQALEDTLYEEMLGRIQEDDESPPVAWHGDWYYTRTEKGRDYPIELRRRGSLNAPEEILLDANVRAEGMPYYDIGHLTVSPDGERLAFAEDTLGRRQYTLRFRDLKRGEDLPDRIEGCSPSIVFTERGQSVVYVKNDPETLRSHSVWLHVLGAHPRNDRLLYQENDESFYTSLELTSSERFVLINLSSTTADEVWVIDTRFPRRRPRLMAKRHPGVHYETDHFGQAFVVRTDWRAPDGKLMRVPEWQLGSRSAWQTIVPGRQGRMIESFELFKEGLAIEVRERGQTSIRILDWALTPLDTLLPKSPAGVLELEGYPDPEANTLRYVASALDTPDALYEWTLESRQSRCIKTQILPSGFQPDMYEALRLEAPARDGARIPISLVRPRGVRGPQALLVYGYGAYGHSIDPDFRVSALSLVDRGVQFAILHVRGGEDLGRRWVEEGRVLNKMNSFTDFIDATQWLIDAGIAKPGAIAAEGGSAGGLLMGAVANLRPDLYRAMLLAVPFLDCLSTMEDPSIPLTTNEYDEWGHPYKAHHYKEMRRWSPYDNLTTASYPAMMVTTGLHDSQVQYWEPVKWVARLRDLKQDPYPVLLHVDLSAGHGGPSGRYGRLREIARDYAFVLHEFQKDRAVS